MEPLPPLTERTTQLSRLDKHNLVGMDGVLKSSHESSQIGILLRTCVLYSVCVLSKPHGGHSTNRSANLWVQKSCCRCQGLLVCVWQTMNGVSRTL